jgi:hypothetical protein
MSDSEDDGDDVPLSHRRPHDGVSRGSRSHSRSDSLPIDQAVERSNSLKRAQKQVSKAQRILGDNINNLEKRSGK